MNRLIALLFLLALTPTYAQQPFDHFSTGFELDGAHTNVTCERCHTGGKFEGTTPVCVSCHSSIGAVQATAKPPNHVASNEICSDCHTTAAWSPVAFMDHAAVTGSCSTCHNNVTATGKPPGHIASTDQCDDCHQTGAWTPAVFDHSNISGDCFSCHNGVDATGKSANHIQTTNTCEDCHSSVGWDPVFIVDHSQVIGSCSSCHDGATDGRHTAACPANGPFR